MTKRQPGHVLIDAEVDNGSAAFAVSSPMLPEDERRFAAMAELLPDATWHAIPVHRKDRRPMSVIIDAARKRW